MLSLERCRTLLGASCTLTDAEVERLRDHVRVVAEIIIDGIATLATETQFTDALRQLPHSAEVEERAAILEVDGGMSRSRAEKTAVMNAATRRHVEAKDQ